MDEFTVSNLVGAILVLAGLYLVLTGAPQVQTAGGSGQYSRTFSTSIRG